VAPFLVLRLLWNAAALVRAGLRRLLGSRRPRRLTPREVLAWLTDRRFHGMPFQPVVEGELLPRHPFDAIEAGLSSDVPVLLGTNLEEAKFFRFFDPAGFSLGERALIARCPMILGRECGVEHAPREPERGFWEFWDAKF
jgi:para-nitrobenzyl esterase